MMFKSTQICGNTSRNGIRQLEFTYFHIFFHNLRQICRELCSCAREEFHVWDPRSRVWDPPLRPPSTLLDIFPGRGPKNLKYSDKFSKHFSFSREKKPPKYRPTGGQGRPQNLFCPKSYFFFFYLKRHAKFQNPTITPSGRKVTGAERRRRRNPLLAKP
jgi:hypothetical protein